MSEKNQSPSGFVSDLSEAAARNPMSAALIGMGVLWMLTGAKSPMVVGNALRDAGLDHVPDALNDVGSAVKEKVGYVADAAASAVDATRERGVAMFDNVAGYGQSVREPATALRAAQDGLSDLLRSQPLTLGVIGLAMGAGIAAALPRTQIEDAYLGEASETIRTQAAEIAGQQVEKATAVAGEIVEAVSAEARKQGLTPEGAKAAVDDMTARVTRIVDVAKSPSTGKQS